nr:9145_t:CDS:10 [Entrophospora candida]
MSSSGTIISFSQRSYDGDNDFQDEELEEDKLEVQKIMNNSRDALLFVIYCTPTMFSIEPSQNSEQMQEQEQYSTFNSIIKCISEIMFDKMTTEQNKDLMGVMLIGTKNAQNRLEKDHIYVLQNIDSLDIHRIKELNEIVSGDFDFEEKIGIWDGEFPFGDVFWVCSDIFNPLTSTTIKTKRIFLVTSVDNPHPTNKYLRSSTMTRAKDLIESKIAINIFGINSKPDEPFNLDAFYSELLTLDNDITNYSFVSTSKDYEKMALQIKSKEAPKRSTFSIPFRLFEDELTIGVKGYSMIIQKDKPTYKYVHMRSETARVAEIKTEWICADTTQRLMKEDMKLYYPYDEIAKIKSIDDRKGITLLGFKPASYLKFEYNLEHSLFIYPDEEQYEGSTRTFAALHKKMLELDKIAICFITRSVGRPPSYVALKPQVEILDENEQQIESPGFHLIILPSAEDIRPHPPNAKIAPAPDESVNYMNQIIDNLIIKDGYDPNKFPNPLLERFYHVLKQIALNESLSIETPDATIPKYSVIDENVGELIEEFNKVARNIESNQMNMTPESLTESASSSSRRKSSTPKLGVEELYRQDMATVAELKAYLESKGLRPHGKKPDLMKQVEVYLG